MTQATPIVLRGDCIVSTIHHSYRTLIEAFRSEGPLVIDLSQVAAADVSLMQLIVSAFKTAASTRRSLSLKSVPNSIYDLLGSTGVTFDTESGRVTIKETLHADNPDGRRFC